MTDPLETPCLCGSALPFSECCGRPEQPNHDPLSADEVNTLRRRLDALLTVADHIDGHWTTRPTLFETLESETGIIVRLMETPARRALFAFLLATPQVFGEAHAAMLSSLRAVAGSGQLLDSLRASWVGVWRVESRGSAAVALLGPLKGHPLPIAGVVGVGSGNHGSTVLGWLAPLSGSLVLLAGPEVTVLQVERFGRLAAKINEGEAGAFAARIETALVATVLFRAPSCGDQRFCRDNTVRRQLRTALAELKPSRTDLDQDAIEALAAKLKQRVQLIAKEYRLGRVTVEAAVTAAIAHWSLTHNGEHAQ